MKILSIILGFGLIFTSILAKADIEKKFAWDLSTNDTDLAFSSFYISSVGPENNNFEKGETSANFVAKIPFSSYDANFTHSWEGPLNGSDVWIRVTCTDVAGNESDFSNFLYLRLDNVSPEAPVNLRLQVVMSDGKMFIHIQTSRPLNENEYLQTSTDLQIWGTNLTKELIFEIKEETSKSFFV